MQSANSQELNGLVLADPHVGGKWDSLDRTEDIISCMHRAVEMASKNLFQLLINLGDTFHTNDPTPRQIARVIDFYQRLEAAGIWSITLEGNHDHRGRSEKGSALEPLMEVGFKFAQFYHSEPSVRCVIGQHFVVIPHVSEEVLQTSMPGLLRDLEAVPVGRQAIGLCHLDIGGATAGAERFVLRHQPASLPPELVTHPKISVWLAGHIHKPQELYNNKLVVVGSILQHDFGEVADQKRCLTIGTQPQRVTGILETGGPKLRQFDLDFTDPEGNAEQLYEHFLGGYFEHLGIDKDDIVKINVRITDEQYVTKNFPAIEANLNQHCKLLKKISPAIIRSREYRMRELTDTEPDEVIAERYLRARGRGDVDSLVAKNLAVIRGVRENES